MTVETMKIQQAKEQASELIAQSLEALEIKHVFGIIGAGNGKNVLPLALDLVDRLDRPRVNHPREIMRTDRETIASRFPASRCVAFQRPCASQPQFWPGLTDSRALRGSRCRY
jgi:multidrug efflux pump subunit AcrB